MKTTQEIEEHYNSHSEFYEQWTAASDGGYHFGFPKNILDIFDNQKMILNLSDLVIDELQIQKGETVLDAGCGVGHVSFRIEERYKNSLLKIFGVTISEKQQAIGEEKRIAKQSSVEIRKEDFEHMHFSDGMFDKVLFVDSLCHGTGEAKSPVLKEMSRVMKSGGTLVISDVFLKKSPENLGRYFRYVNKKVTAAWSVSEWAVESKFVEEATKHDFKVLKEQDLTMKIPPSVLYAPLRWLPYAMVRSLFDQRYKIVRRTLLRIGFFAPLLGIHPNFRYKVLVLQKG